MYEYSYLRIFYDIDIINHWCFIKRSELQLRALYLLFKGNVIILLYLQSLQAGWVTSRQIEAAVFHFLCFRNII